MDNLVEQVMETQQLGENIGAMAVKLRVQKWMIEHAKQIPPHAFRELREIVAPGFDARAEENDMATRAAHSYGDDV